MPTAADWTFWALILLIGFPVLVIALGELQQRLQERDDAHTYVTPLAILRNGVLPLAFVDGMLRVAVGWGSDALAVRIADTALWIVALNAGIAFLNGLLFGREAQLAGRVRVPRLLLDLTRLVLVLCGAAVVVARVWGVDLSSLITALGVGSVVLGLALQDTLGSIFAGIALVSARQVHVGDWIKFGGNEGVVLAMNWRAVKIRTSAGDVLYVPNGTISKESVRVLTLGVDTTSLGVSIWFPYSVSPETAMKLLAEVALTTKGFHVTPPPSASIASFDDNGIQYAIGMRATDPRALGGVRSEYLSNLWYAAQRRGLVFSGSLNGAFQGPDHAPRPAKPAPATIVDMLQSVGAFRLDPDQLKDLVQNARVEQYRTGQTVVAQGIAATDVYVLTRGIGTAAFVRADEPDVTLHRFEPGQTMMAKSLFQGIGTPLTFKAETELEVVAIPVSDFKQVCLDNVALARQIEQILATREEVADRVLANALPDARNSLGLSDRVQLVREMFRS